MIKKKSKILISLALMLFAIISCNDDEVEAKFQDQEFFTYDDVVYSLTSSSHSTSSSSQLKIDTLIDTTIFLDTFEIIIDTFQGIPIYDTMRSNDTVAYIASGGTIIEAIPDLTFRTARISGVAPFFYVGRSLSLLVDTITADEITTCESDGGTVAGPIEISSTARLSGIEPVLYYTCSKVADGEFYDTTYITGYDTLVDVSIDTLVVYDYNNLIVDSNMYFWNLNFYSNDENSVHINLLVEGNNGIPNNIDAAFTRTLGDSAYALTSLISNDTIKDGTVTIFSYDGSTIDVSYNFTYDDKTLQGKYVGEITTQE